MANRIDSNMASFAADVIEASNSQLVLVDFWADWCQPCRSLAPILERLVDQYQGAVKLVKINTDDNQELAGQLGIRSLPTVFFFKQGRVVDQFAGVQAEAKIRAIIDKHADGQAGAEAELEAAARTYEEGNTDEARALVTRLINNDPKDEKPRLLLLGWLCKEGNDDDAEAIAESISEKGRESPEYRAYLARQSFREQTAGLPAMDELIEAVESDENDLRARFQLSQRYIAKQNYAEGMDQLLEIIKRDRNFQAEAPRKTMIEVFGLLGGKGDLVSRYRGRLSRILN